MNWTKKTSYFWPLGSKKSNFLKFHPPPYKYHPNSLNSFHTYFISFLLSSLLFYTQRHGELQLESWLTNVGWSFEHHCFASSSHFRRVCRCLVGPVSHQHHAATLSFNHLQLTHFILPIPLSTVSIPSTSGRWFIRKSWDLLKRISTLPPKIQRRYRMRMMSRISMCYILN
jgi:hypothetical protein